MLWFGFRGQGLGIMYFVFLEYFVLLLIVLS